MVESQRIECDLRKTGVRMEEENEGGRERRVGKLGWLVGEAGRKNKEEDETKELEIKEEMEDLERYGEEQSWGFEENERMGVEVRKFVDEQKREGGVERRQVE